MIDIEFREFLNFCGPSVPWFIKEAIIGNVVIGNFTKSFAEKLVYQLEKQIFSDNARQYKLDMQL